MKDKYRYLIHNKMSAMASYHEQRPLDEPHMTREFDIDSSSRLLAVRYWWDRADNEHAEAREGPK